MATLPASSDGDETDNTTSQYGTNPDASDTLVTRNRSVSSVSQGVTICTNLIYAWQQGIKAAARITAKINGERPYSQSKLKNQAKDWKTNISTGFLSTECSKVVPRFYMPIKSAQYLTAASLPAGTAAGEEKTELFRSTITEAIRGWSKWNFFLRGLAREVGVFGFGFATYFDEFDWRPNLIRMDKGFVPQGTEVMDYEIPFYCVKWDYQITELLELARRDQEAGLNYWKPEAVAKAVNEAQPKPAQTTEYQYREFEELIRQNNAGYAYSRGVNVIETYHLYAQEYDGGVSHYIFRKGGDQQDALLYERLDAYPSMSYVVIPMVFEFGDGTIHGSWGAGQILYDMAVQVEKIRNDSIDNLRNSNKIKVNVPEGKNVNDVKITVTDTQIIVSGGQFSGNTAALSVDSDGYIKLDQQMSTLAQQKIGAYVPPIPLQPSDIKAAQVNTAVAQEQEIQQALLDNWLSQFAQLVNTMTRRLCNPDSPDVIAQAVQAKLKNGGLSDDEIKQLANQSAVQTITEFTPFASARKAAFAQSVISNPMFNSHSAARVMAEGVGGQKFADYIVNAKEDPTNMADAQNKQILETSTLHEGTKVPVVTTDNDWVHMQTLKPVLIGITQQTAQSGNVAPARAMLEHYGAHYAQGVTKQGIPKESINAEKSFIAQVERAISDVEKAASQAQGGAPAQIQQTQDVEQARLQSLEPSQEALATVQQPVQS